MARAVKITGARSLRRVLRRAPDEVATELRGAIKAGADDVQADMLKRVPRRTGALASVIKIKASRDGLSAKVGPGAKGKRDMKKAGRRAHFTEFGTKHHAAQPFVGPALKQNRPGISQAISSAVGKALAKLSRLGQ